MVADSFRSVSTEDLFLYAQTGLVLTATNRLARSLRRRYDDRQRQAGFSAWRSPEILPISAWYRKQFDRFRGEGCLLTGSQAEILWEKAVEEDLARTGHDLLQITTTARMAGNAFQLLVQHGVSPDFEPETEEQHAWLRWYGGWRAKADLNGWIDSAEVSAFLTEAFGSGKLPPPARIMLAGFDRIPPDLGGLLQALERRRSQVMFWQPEPVRRTDPILFAAADPVDEVRSCARWARQILNATPEAKIGVVLPRMEHYRDLLELTFQSELDPAGTLRGIETEHAFALSLGKSLKSEGVIESALLVLGLDRVETSDTLGKVFRSPYLAATADHRFWRADVDRQLRSRRQRDRSLKSLETGIDALLKVPVPVKRQLRRQLKAVLAFQEQGRRMGCGIWAERFAELLDAVGWPGYRPVQSREYQAIEKFKELLGEFASLDRLGVKMSRTEAVGLLRRMAQQTMFQPESPEGNLQLLGILEAGGLSFDHLWIMGMQENAFPQAPQPNPFIPLGLQKRCDMPHVDAEHELAWAEDVLRRLVDSGGRTVVSWSQQEEGVPQRRSRLVALFADGVPDMAESCDPVRRIAEGCFEIEELVDEQAPGLPEHRTLSGGTRLLQDQALCPFRALAHHRLRCAGLEEPDIGLDGLTRGSLVHRLLESIWKQLGSRQRLLQLTPAEREEFLHREAAIATESLIGCPALQRRLEQKRLVRLVDRWLDHEAARPEFSVELIEKDRVIAVGPLQVKTKVDRIDRLADGSLAVIDYKTGKPEVADWFGERIREPQLPVYCSPLDNVEIGAVLYAAIRPDPREMEYLGVVREPAGWPEKLARRQSRLFGKADCEDLGALLRHWERTLEDLGRAFVAGEAFVDPLDGGKTCQQCDLSLLCRIAELGGTREPDEGGRRD